MFEVIWVDKVRHNEYMVTHFSIFFRFTGSNKISPRVKLEHPLDSFKNIAHLR